jgi:hypothetical protein
VGVQVYAKHLVAARDVDLTNGAEVEFIKEALGIQAEIDVVNMQVVQI